MTEQEFVKYVEALATPVTWDAGEAHYRLGRIRELCIERLLTYEAVSGVVTIERVSAPEQQKGDEHA